MSFRFKQFFVQDDRCAMKIGTDGVLLGAWAPTGTRILDVGTGCGLIALMMAQRCPKAQIDAIDIDTAAVEQAKENGANAFLSRLQDWQENSKYDLVVSNPPYFRNSLKNPDRGRQTARHTDTLSYEELLHHSARLLTDTGQLALILPAEAEAEVRQLAASEGFALARITRVYSKESKPARRVLMAFVMTTSRRDDITTVEDTLVLEDDKGGRSRPYQDLCKDFYL